MMSIQGLSGFGNQTVRTAEGSAEASAAERSVTPNSQPVSEEKTETKTMSLDGERVDRVVKSLNNLAQSLKRKIEFSINDETGQTVIRIVDSENAKVIRQIPPEEMMRLAEHLKDIQGLILDSTA